MNNKILFQEKQYMRQIWLWLLFVGIFISINYSLYFEENINLLEVLICNLPLIIVMFFMLTTKLKTKIDENSINFEFFPFHIGFIDFKFQKMEKSIPFEAIEKMEVVTYNPIFDYGGWGIRFGGMNTICYNTMGNKGLMIYKKNKEKVLIGTQKPLELEKIINQISLQNESIIF
jgi:hypothetical protein